MASDEEWAGHEHVVEITNDSPELRGPRRRSFATIAVAVCLGLAGAVTAFALVRDQSEMASDKQRNAEQREQLLDGWNTLGAVAAAQRASDALRAPAAPSAPPSPGVANAAKAPANGNAAPQPGAPTPVQNVIVVGSPAPAAAPSQSLPAPTSGTTPLPAPGLTTPVGIPAPPSAPNQTPLTPAPGSPDTVLSPITYPASQSCGLSTCNVDSVCCNVSCGVCTAPGESCSQTQCG